MSEYQYYEFLAVDHPLTEAQMQTLRAISTRAEITTTRFANHYSFGDLKADPLKLLARFFDVHVYVAMGCVRQLALRLPREAIDRDAVQGYRADEVLRIVESGDHVIVELGRALEEFREWDTGEGWMSALTGVRTALLAGDRRPLYLGWLASLDGEARDEVEPPVPPGLATLPAALEALARFLWVDEHLVAAAAEGSPSDTLETAALAEWIGALSAAEKDALLLRVAQGQHAAVASALGRRFRAAQGSARPAAPPPRTVRQLFDRATELRAIAAEQSARRAAEARRQREAAATAARARHLDLLAGQESTLWLKVRSLLFSTTPRAYDEATAHLIDLRDLAARAGADFEFAGRLAALRRNHARKRSFINRLDAAGLK
ncbi:MAG: hypothetical protein KC620_06300 [Myxococcales bacterium]|nr:hypothetical protein [Myxococcales bacterium]